MSKSINSLNSVVLTERDGTIVKKEAGYCLFNRDGKLVSMNQNPGPVYKLSLKIGYKLVNETSVKGQMILQKTRTNLALPARRRGVVVENVIRG